MEAEDEYTYNQLNEIGISLFNKKKYAEALVYFERAINKNDSSEILYFNKASCEENLKHYSEAIKDYEKGLEINPKTSDALYDLFKLYKIKGDFNEAIDTIKKLIKLEPLNNTFNQALTLIQDLKKLENKVEELTENKEFEEAEETCAYLLKESPQAPFIQINYIEILLEGEKYSEIVSFIEDKVCQENVKSYRFFNCNYARSLHYCWQKDETKYKLLQLIDDSEFRSYFFGGGEELLKEIENELGISEEIEKYIDAQKFKQVINRVDSTMINNSRNKSFIVEILLSRAKSYLCLNKKLEALNDCNECIKINPVYPFSYLTRGIVFEKMRKFYDARKDEEKAKYLGLTINEVNDCKKFYEKFCCKETEINNTENINYATINEVNDKKCFEKFGDKETEVNNTESMNNVSNDKNYDLLKRYLGDPFDCINESLEEIEDSEENKNENSEENKQVDPKLKKFFEILPCVLKSNANNNIESFNSCLKEISKNKIKIKKENKFSCRESESNSSKSIIEDNDISLGLSMLNKGVNLRFQFNQNKEYKEKYSSIIIKRIIYSVSINEEDIAFKPFFIKKLKVISKLDCSDEEKAGRLDELFKENGLYIPLKFYIGGLFSINTTNMDKAEKNDFLAQINADLKIKLVDMKKRYNKHFGFKTESNYRQKDHRIIGGEINNDYSKWIESINLENSDVIEYTEFRNIYNFLDQELEIKLNKPIELLKQKYKKRLNYLKTTKELLEKKSSSNYYYCNGDSNLKIGICDKNNLEIELKTGGIYEEHSLFRKKTTVFSKEYQEIIVGLEIISRKHNNGEFSFKNPLLENELRIEFISDKSHSLNYDINIYLMKCPE